MRNTCTLILSILSFNCFSQSWGEIVKTVASDRAQNDRYGYCVSISGDKAIVGAFGESSYAGAAYILELNGGTWTETAILVASDRAANDRFGISVDISGDIAVVGAYYEDDDASGGSSLTEAGSAYVYELNGGVWSESAKLVASDRAAGDQFGRGVSIHDDIIIVGAPEQDEGVGGTLQNAGSAYVFEPIGGTWLQTAKLVTSDRATDDNFGLAVSVSGNRAVIGAYLEDDDASGGASMLEAGSAYVFEMNGGVWSETAKLVPSDRAAEDRFGYSACISDDRIVVGSYLDDEDEMGGATLDGSGSAYVYDLVGGSWVQIAKLVPSDRGDGDRFGVTLSVSGDKVIVGADREDEDGLGGASLSNSGSAYVFELIGGVWQETDKLVASDREAEDLFGRGVSISQNNIIVGAYAEDHDTSGLAQLTRAGSAYIFEYTNPLGVSNNGFERGVQLYPNPTISKLTFSNFDGEIDNIKVFDATGKQVKSFLSNSAVIDVSELTPGIYFIQLEINHVFVSKKFVKQ